MLKLFLPSVCYAIISNRHADFNTLLGHVKVLLNGFFRQNRLAALFLMVSWKLVFHLTDYHFLEVTASKKQICRKCGYTFRYCYTGKAAALIKSRSCNAGYTFRDRQICQAAASTKSLKLNASYTIRNRQTTEFTTTTKCSTTYTR